MPITPINNLVDIMREVGYDLPDMLPAFPGYALAKLAAVQRDCGLALNRPYIGYGMLGVSPCRTKYFNVSSAGFRLPGTDQPWPPSSDNLNVFLFGGSTAFSYYVADEDTIAVSLEKSLRQHHPDVVVYNFAGGSYTSREEALRFTQLIDMGIKADLAVFLDGYNDAYYAFGNPGLTVALDALYREEKRRRKKGFIAAVGDYALSRFLSTISLPSVRDIPTTDRNLDESDLTTPEAVHARLKRAADPEDQRTTPAEGRVAERIWSRYLDSFALIRGLADRRQIPIHVFLQPTPFYGCRPEHRIMERLFARLAQGSLSGPYLRWLHAQGLPDIPGLRFTDLSLAGWDQDGVLYLDVCHYAPKFSRHLGTLLAHHILPFLGEIACSRTTKHA
jgi:hypothetical protein